MIKGSHGAGGHAAAPASWVIAVVVGLCAVLLLKWIALVALVALAVLGFARWARGGPHRDAATIDIDAGPDGRRHDDERHDERVSDERVSDEYGRDGYGRDGYGPDGYPRAAVPAPAPAPRREVDPDDCRWCGLPGGHRDDAGRLLRPRHVHVLR